MMLKNLDRLLFTSHALRSFALVVLVNRHGQHQQHQQNNRDCAGNRPVNISGKFVIKKPANHLNIAAPKQIGNDILARSGDEH